VNTEVNETRKMCSCSIKIVQTRSNRSVCIIIPSRRGKPTKGPSLAQSFWHFFWSNFSTAFNGSDYITFQMSFIGKMNTASVSALCYVMW